MKESSVNCYKISMKRLRIEVDKTNKKKLRYQVIAATKDKETICLIFSYCTCTPKVKLNTNRQMDILSKTVCIIDGITLLMALHQVNNFRLYKKQLHLLSKKVGYLTKNSLLGVLESGLEKIWKNGELLKLRLLLSKNEDWFDKTLQWAVQKKYG